MSRHVHVFSWWLALALAGTAATGRAQPVNVAHLAGSTGGPGVSDGTGALARLCGPAGVAAADAGTIYVADAGSSTIRRITGTGVVTVFAGAAGQPGRSDGTGTAARFRGPLGLAVDANGNVWVADTGNHTIRKITSGGAVTTFAGAAGQPGTADGTGTNARFSRPAGIAAAGGGVLWVADTGNHTIRRIASDGSVTTIAGLAGQAGTSDGAGTAARFSAPTGLAVAGDGWLLVADTDNHLVRRVSAAGEVTTVAGRAGEPGSADGASAAATFSWPTGVAVDGAGMVYVADSHSHALRRLAPTGQVRTLAGKAGVPGSTDGDGEVARFFVPLGLGLNAAGVLLVADSANHTVRTVTTAGQVDTLAGRAPARGWLDAVGAAARFASPSGLAIEADGSLVVADSDNHVLRRISATGVVRTLAGAAGEPGTTDGTGEAARFRQPFGVVRDAAGNLFVADSGNHAIRRVTPTGTVTTLAGSPGTPGAADGTGPSAHFNTPRGLAIDAAGSLYVADSGNHAIRKVTAGGAVTTLAGGLGVTGSSDGVGAAARFNWPEGVAAESGGTLYVADSGNAVVRKVTTGGSVSTLAGTAGELGEADGVGTAARFRFPGALVFDSAQSLLYVGDDGRVRRVTLGGEVITVLGSATMSGSDDGLGTLAHFGEIGGLALGGQGMLYASDMDNDCVRRAAPGSTVAPKVTAVSPSSAPRGGGALVTITGSNFSATGLSVEVGGVALRDVEVVGPGTITGYLPGGSIGSQSVRVSSLAGQSTLSSAFSYTRHSAYLAEGATSGFFDVELALLNPTASAVATTLRFLKKDGTEATRALTVGAGRRATVWPRQVSGMSTAEFSTLVESDAALVVDRTMAWGGGEGSHAETSVAAPALTWYLAEGATHSNFDLFYLVQNATITAADLEVTYLLPGGTAPLVRQYTVAPRSRFNIWVDTEPGLGNTDVSAVLRSANGVPVIVERAMYLTTPLGPFVAGHGSAGVTAPSTSWFLAEGATGSYFDLFVLVANPTDTEAEVEAQYLLTDGTLLRKQYRVAANSRFNIWVDYEEIPEGSGQRPLADVAVSTTITSTNGVPVIVERAMWWPGSSATWREAHNSPGSTVTSTLWGLAAGEVSDDQRGVETFILLANTSPYPGEARVTLHFENGATAARDYALPPNSRTNVWVNADVPEAKNQRFGAIVESLVAPGEVWPAKLVVERAMYSGLAGAPWVAGTNALATPLR